MNRFGIGTLLMFTLFALGCKDDGGRVTVTGTVLFDGQPLESGNISFGGEKGAAGVAPIVNGKFDLSETANQPGVQPGSYVVLIQSWIEERGAVLEDGSFSPGKTRIPLIYLDPAKSGLKAEVKAGQANDFKFELSSKAGEDEKK